MKTTKENNRLIAEFMGYEVYKEPMLEYMFQDWNELMPVIEKIEGLGYTTERNYQRIDRDWQFLITRRSNILFQEFNNDSRIACYDVIVNFIEWYNKNRPIEQDK